MKRQPSTRSAAMNTSPCLGSSRNSFSPTWWIMLGLNFPATTTGSGLCWDSPARKPSTFISLNVFVRSSREGFGSKCEFIGPAEDVTKFVLSHSALGVAFAILHIEWMTLRHYIEGVKDNQNLDPQFTSLLKHHWLEESQHTKLDTLMIESLAQQATPNEIDKAFADYADIGIFLDNGIKQQVEFNLESFTRATGRSLASSEREEI